MPREVKLSEEALQMISKIFTRGNTCELKRVNGQIQIIELERKLRIKENM